MKLGIIRRMHTEDYCPGTTDFKMIKETIRQYHPEVMILNCCEATAPIGRLIMSLFHLFWRMDL